MTSFINKFREKRNSNKCHSEDGGSHKSDSSRASSSDLGSMVDFPNRLEKRISLAYNIDLLINDSSALSFFIHFLESCDKMNLIKFWMHVEGFRASFVGEGRAVETADSLARIDASNIYDTYIVESAAASISLPTRLRKAVEENVSKIPLQCDCFDEAQLFVRRLFELRYFEEFQSSVYYKKHELEVLQSGCSLNDILHVQTLLQSFMEILETDEDRSRVQLLIACDSFEKEYYTLSPEELMSDAMAIYEKYFSMQSRYELIINDVMRVSIESAICTESGRPHIHSFRAAAQEVTRYLHKKYMSSFLSSPAFRSYVDDLASQIDSTIELPRPSGMRQRHGSTSSGSSSIFNKFKKLERCQATPLLRTPRPSLDSPQQSPIRVDSLAEIDSMGRYRTLYDDSLAQDEATTPSKLKLKLRKYLDKSTLREEEIAEEVARTIISDIQNMVQVGKRG